MSDTSQTDNCTVTAAIIISSYITETRPGRISELHDGAGEAAAVFQQCESTFTDKRR